MVDIAPDDAQNFQDNIDDFNSNDPNSNDPDWSDFMKGLQDALDALRNKDVKKLRKLLPGIKDRVKKLRKKYPDDPELTNLLQKPLDMLDDPNNEDMDWNNFLKTLNDLFRNLKVKGIFSRPSVNGQDFQ